MWSKCLKRLKSVNLDIFKGHLIGKCLPKSKEPIHFKATRSVRTQMIHFLGKNF